MIVAVRVNFIRNWLTETENCPVSVPRMQGGMLNGPPIAYPAITIIENITFS